MGDEQEYGARSVDPRHCALIIIDMQNDFISPGGYHHRQGSSCEPLRAIIPQIQSLRRDLPREVKIIHIMTVREPDGSDDHWRIHRLLPERVRVSGETSRPEHNVVRGTWGAEIIDELKPRPEEKVFTKRRYSAFYQSDLEMCLRCWGINTLIFTGVTAEICVETTVRDAFIRDFDVVVVSDGVASGDEEICRSMLKVMAKGFGVVLPADRIIGLFSSLPVDSAL
jgi:nicotinamidase-related amidase